MIELVIFSALSIKKLRCLSSFFIPVLSSPSQTLVLDLKEKASSLASSTLKKDNRLKSLEINLEQKKEECIKLDNQLKKVREPNLFLNPVLKFGKKKKWTCMAWKPDCMPYVNNSKLAWLSRGIPFQLQAGIWSWWCCQIVSAPNQKINFCLH